MKTGSAYIRIKYLLVLLSCVLSSASCAVHEFPEIPEVIEPQVNVNYHLDFIGFDMWNHIYDDEDLYEVGFGDKYQNILDQGTVRYIIRAYPKPEKQRNTQEHVKEFVYTRDIADGYGCDFTLDLPPGNYTIMVWSDFVRNQGDSYFYNADDFAEITLQGEHCGNNHYRDVFRGVADVALPADAIENDIVLDIDMQRPLAKYEFVTTDLAEFLNKERTRSVDDYKVVFYYTGFMPDTYDMFTDKPVDSATGVLFESGLNILSETEASMGFDYVFVNGTQSIVTVRLAVYNSDGELVSSTNPVNVPLKRSCHTVLKGSFLSQKASEGVGINPEFNGDFNIPI